MPCCIFDVDITTLLARCCEFAADEVVKEKKLGDSIAWQTLIKDSFLYIKPVEPDASGNLVVIANKRTYFFKLKSSNTDMTYLVRFKYSDGSPGSDANDAANRFNQHASKPFNPEKFNLNYAYAGKSSEIQLKNVFDTLTIVNSLISNSIPRPTCHHFIWLKLTARKPSLLDLSMSDYQSQGAFAKVGLAGQGEYSEDHLSKLLRPWL